MRRVVLSAGCALVVLVLLDAIDPEMSQSLRVLAGIGAALIAAGALWDD